MNNCEVCYRIDLIEAKKNPCFVAELETGYVVLCDYQSYKGYTLFICKQHVAELHELAEPDRALFLMEMTKVAQSVYQAFHPNKLNYELLGNVNTHLHWHIIPRLRTDVSPNLPIWALPEENRSYIPTTQELSDLKNLLLNYL